MRHDTSKLPCATHERLGWLWLRTRSHAPCRIIAARSQNHGGTQRPVARPTGSPSSGVVQPSVPPSAPAGTVAGGGGASPLGPPGRGPHVPGQGASWASGAVSGRDLNSSLLAALAEQFRREALPWIQDLVEPWIQGPPPPLTDTVPPEMLVDRDSRFTTANGVRIHYKMSLPGERESQPPAAQPGQAATPRTDVSTAVTEGWRGPFSAPSSAGPSSALLSTAAAVAAMCPHPDAAPALLLMHGLNGSTFNWRLLMDDLAAYTSPSTGGCRVIAYDRPPYGLSQRPLQWSTEEDNPYTLEGGARLASALLTTLVGPPSSAPERSSGVTRGPAACRAVVVGHSAGAAVAVETALRYPDQVCGLVLISPAISTDPRGFLARADLGQLLRFGWTRMLLSADGPGLNYVRRQVLKRRAEVEAGRLGIYADESEVPQEVINGYLKPLRAKDWDKGTLLVYRSLQVAGEPQPLEQLQVPVLVLQGADDRTVPLEAAQRVTDALRRRGAGVVTEFVVLERCAHVPMDEQPLAVLHAIADFVNRHCCAAAGNGDARPPIPGSAAAAAATASTATADVTLSGTGAAIATEASAAKNAAP